MNNTELINVAQASNYLWEFDQELYTKTYSEAMMRLTKFSEEDKSILNSIYTTDDIIHDNKFK